MEELRDGDGGRMDDGGAEAQSGLESELRNVLENLSSLSGEVNVGYVISVEGQVLASAAGEDAGGDRVGAMISTLSGAASRRARESGHDAYSQLRVRAEEGYVLLTRLSDGSTLAATTGPEARVGLVLYDMRNARPEAERVLSESDEQTGGR